MRFTLVKNFTIVFLKIAYDRLTEKDKITHLPALIKNIELKSHNEKKILSQLILEVVDSLYSLYECSRLLSYENEALCQSQSLKFEIMCYLCKSKLAENIFPSMLHVSLDCLYSPKTDVNLQRKGADFIQWITRTADTSIVELIGKVLLFGLLKIIKETRIGKFNDLMREQEINPTLLFKPFYGSPDLSIHNPEEDNEILKVIVIKFYELDQLDQIDQWTNEENIQALINILDENIDELADILQINQSTSKNKNYQELANRMLKNGYHHENRNGVEKDEHKTFIYHQKSAEMGDTSGMYYVGYCYQHGIGVEKDEHKAFIYYQKSAEMGNAIGMCNVGACYLDGIGVEKDEHKVFIYCQKSAEMGNAGGMCNLAYCYQNGIGVEKDEHKAFIYYQKSAEMGGA
ncbi:hypothetical protein C2G38_2253693 [Gigaspora rosea]|uniref:Proteasome component Ecm29 N-terminal domain-containing protein n=1 Tax=Gigaspora rosea TaxID=44941 RepID=A0A397U5T2_9GLOM|nr:hypothetical protein C2G38_2253693 [Gigaspora rosea]